MSKTKQQTNGNGKRNITVIATIIAGAILLGLTLIVNCAIDEVNGKVDKTIYDRDQKEIKKEITEVKLEIKEIKRSSHKQEIEQAKQGQIIRDMAHKMRVPVHDDGQ